MVLSALYYPHTSVKNESFLKTSLLLWDQLEYISPLPGFVPQYADTSMSRAMELFGRPHIPSQEEKLAAHNAILRIVESGIPNWLIDECRSDVEPNDYYIVRHERAKGGR
jgi:hypothetical protein